MSGVYVPATVSHLISMYVIYLMNEGNHDNDVLSINHETFPSND
jgi:hypothetical protein